MEETVTQKKGNDIQSGQRYAWVDVMKFIGIFVIYIGHVAVPESNLFSFVFHFHVPLFFLLSGCFAGHALKRPFHENLLKRIQTILIPYYFFCLINIILLAFTDGVDATSTFILLKQGLLGMRNNGIASALWFLPCLFVMSLVFDLMARVFMRFSPKNWKYYIVGATIILYYLCNWLISPPKWFFSIDSALYYMVYYAIGNLVFPLFRDFSFFTKTRFQKIVILLISLIAFADVAVECFKGEGMITYVLRDVMLMQPPNYIMWGVNVIQALIIIYAVYLMARLCENVLFFANMGKETLFFCGTENIIKATIEALLSLVGLQLCYGTSWMLFIYVFICLTMSYFLLVPLIKEVLDRIVKFVGKLVSTF